MPIAFFDCFSGISGDMILGALIDAGLNPQILEDRLKALSLDGYDLTVEKTVKQGISGTKVWVNLTATDFPHRHLADIYHILEHSALPDKIIKTAKKIFTNLAKAEAKVHHLPPHKVHFHEVGAVDALVDIVGSLIGLEELGLEEIYCSPLHVGSGFVECQHGLLPVPAPATLELLEGVPVYSKDVRHELVTPTGAAIITTIAKDFSTLPEMVIAKTGYGAGTKDLEIPNFLRLIIGEKKGYMQDVHHQTVTMLETNIDDMNPQFYDHLFYKLFLEGALDVYLSSVLMKKNRPGSILHVITSKEKEEKIIQTIFRETTTLGVRSYEIEQISLAYEHIPVQTKYGSIKVRLGKKGEEILSITPDYEDCRLAANKYHVPLKNVYDLAKLHSKDMLT